MPRKNKENTLEYVQEKIKEKQDFAKSISPNNEIEEEICYQIKICEELCKPLSETQIEELVTMTMCGMLNKIRTHKLG